MNKQCILLSAGAWLIAASVGMGVDSIKTKSGSVLGKIISASPFKVEIEQGAMAERKEIPVNQIDFIFYNDEPGLLKNAKNNILGERYEEALNAVARLKTDAVYPQRNCAKTSIFTRLCATLNWQLAATAKLPTPDD